MNRVDSSFPTQPPYLQPAQSQYPIEPCYPLHEGLSAAGRSFVASALVASIVAAGIFVIQSQLPVSEEVRDLLGMGMSLFPINPDVLIASNIGLRHCGFTSDNLKNIRNMQLITSFVKGCFGDRALDRLC